MEILPIGSVAPDFSLPIGSGESHNGKDEIFQLSSVKNQNIVLVFYPADWSGVCSSQIAIYNELISVFEQYNAELLGISVDGTFCHQAFKEHNNIKLRLLCDFEPKGEVSKLYGAYNHEHGFSQRAIYVLDKNKTIRYSYLSPLEVNPGAKEILETLKTMNHEP